MDQETAAKIFGKNLQRIMKEKDISGNKLAKAIGIDRSSISKYINGESSPRIDTLSAICVELKIDANQLLRPTITGSERKCTCAAEIISAFICLATQDVIQKKNDEYVLTLRLPQMKKIMDEIFRYKDSQLITDTDIWSKLLKCYTPSLESDMNNDKIYQRYLYIEREKLRMKQRYGYATKKTSAEPNGHDRKEASDIHK